MCIVTTLCIYVGGSERVPADITESNLSCKNVLYVRMCMCIHVAT